MIGSKDHFQKKNANYFVKAAKLSTLRAKSRLNFLSECLFKVQIFYYSDQNVIGISRLQDSYPQQSDRVCFQFHIQRDKVYRRNLSVGQKFPCVNFNKRVSEVNAKMIKEEASIQLQKNLH